MACCWSSMRVTSSVYQAPSTTSGAGIGRCSFGVVLAGGEDPGATEEVVAQLGLEISHAGVLLTQPPQRRKSLDRGAEGGSPGLSNRLARRLGSVPHAGCLASTLAFDALVVDLAERADVGEFGSGKVSPSPHLRESVGSPLVRKRRVLDAFFCVSCGCEIVGDESGRVVPAFTWELVGQKTESPERLAGIEGGRAPDHGFESIAERSETTSRHRGATTTACSVP